MDQRPFDADNHYYEPLDAFTRHLDKAMRQRAVRTVQDGKRVELLVAGRVNKFVPNPTFDPIIVPGCLDPLFRGQIPEGVDPRTLMQTEPLRAEYQDRDRRLEVMDEQGLGAALLFPTLGVGVEEGLREDIGATMAAVSSFNRWLEEDWGFAYQDRIFAVPLLSLADPDAAVTEVEWLLEHGVRMVHVRPAPVPGPNGTSRSLGHKLHDPVWARLAEASVPVAFHLGDSGYQARFSTAWGGRGTFGFGNSDPLGQILVSDRPIHDTVASMLMHGVFTRHPALRVASIENGSDWLPLLAKRLRKQRNQTPWVFEEDPLETLRRHVWVTPYLEEDLEALADADRRRAHPVRLGLAPRRGGGPAPRLPEGAVCLRRAGRPADHARQLRRAPRLRRVSDGEAPPRPHAELWDEVTGWLEEHWDPDLPVEAWWKVVAEAGWTAPHFEPEQGGRGLSRRSGAVVRAAFVAFGALRPPGGLGLLMAAPTILTQGTPDQIERFVPPILDGSVGWCQLFSEPGAGSDLAGLTTRAHRDGDQWVINGQKVWSSQALQSDYGMLLARTDLDVPKHKGISWFAFRLDQPGVTIRPLREMTGDAVFNEVFLDDAVCEDRDLIGGAGNGWMVTQTTLHFERTGIGAGGSHAGFPEPGPKGGMHGLRAGDAALLEAPNAKLTVNYEDVARLVHEAGRADDPGFRQDLARLYTYTQLGLWNAQRSKAEAERGGGHAVASVGKLTQTDIVKLAARLGVDALGPHGLLTGEAATEGGVFAKALVFSPASSIYGGSDQIQRNIIAERSLGLPRDDAPDRGRPFGEVLRERVNPT